MLRENVCSDATLFAEVEAVNFVAKVDWLLSGVISDVEAYHGPANARNDSSTDCHNAFVAFLQVSRRDVELSHVCWTSKANPCATVGEDLCGGGS